MGIAGYKGSDQRKEKKGGSLDKIIIVSEKSYGIILLTQIKLIQSNFSQKLIGIFTVF